MTTPRDEDTTVVEVETVEADYVTLDFCEHGHATLSLFWRWRETPFAVAQMGPEAVAEMLQHMADNLKTKGTA